jgi:hypothetical protein
MDTRRVQAFACCKCDSVFLGQAEADACCRCAKCGGKFERTNDYTVTCDGCAWGERVRDARREVRRAKQSVVDAERRLADLLTRKPRKASTPPAPSNIVKLVRP